MAFEVFKLVGKIVLDGTDKVDKSIKRNSKSLDGLANQMKKLGIISTAAMTGTVIAAIKFEQQMANVATQLDDTTMRLLPQFSEGITELSKTFGESTKTLSKGLFDILSAGIDAGEAMGVLEASARSAKAGLTDAGTAADAITTLLNAYGLEAQKAGEISDFLFSVVRRGKTTFNELAPVIGRVASLAATAGLDMDELGAALATMTKSGIKTEEAVTSLRGVLNTFLSPTKEAEKVARELGVALDTNTLRSEGLVPVLEKLTQGTDEQIAAIFGNIRALSGLSTILKDTNVFYDDLAFVQDKAGKTQEAFAKNTDTTGFLLQQMQQKLIALAVTLGNEFLPDVNKAADLIGSLIDKIMTINPLIIKMGLAFGALLLPLGIFLTQLPKVILSLQLMGKFALIAMASLGKLKLALIGLNATSIILGGTIALTIIAIVNLIGKLDELKIAHDELNESQKSAAEKQRELKDLIQEGVEVWKQYGDATTESLLQQNISMDEAKTAMEGMFALSATLQGEDRERWLKRAEVFQQVLNALKKANKEEVVDTKKKTADEIKLEKEKFDKLTTLSEQWGAAFEGDINNMLLGTVSFAKGVEDMAESIRKEFFRIIAQMTARWLAFTALQAIGNVLTGGLFGGVGKGLGKLLGFAGGADFTVPSGFPADSFVMPPVGLTSGERVQITPAGKSFGGGRSGDSGTNIYNTFEMPIENINLTPENPEDQAKRFTEGIKQNISEFTTLVKEIDSKATEIGDES